MFRHTRVNTLKLIPYKKCHIFKNTSRLLSTVSPREIVYSPDANPEVDASSSFSTPFYYTINPGNNHSMVPTSHHDYRHDEIQITILGSTSANASESRNNSSILVRPSTTETWLFDAGEGTCSQLSKMKCPPSTITKLFISHCHADHIMGIPALLIHLSVAKKQPFEIYGPVGISEFINATLRFSRIKTMSSIVINEFIPVGTPLQYLPIKALYDNNLPPHQKPLAPRPKTRKSLGSSENVRYFFANPNEVDLSQYDPSNNLDICDTSVSGVKKSQNMALTQTKPITFTFNNLKVHAILSGHTSPSWGYILEEDEPRFMNKDFTAGHPGPYLRALKNGNVVAIPKDEYRETNFNGFSTKMAGMNDSDLKKALSQYTVHTLREHQRYLNFGVPLSGNDFQFPSDFPSNLIPYFDVFNSNKLTRTIPPRKVALLFDRLGMKRINADALNLLQNVDVMIHEATFFQHDVDAEKVSLFKQHSTASKAADFAKLCNVKNLVLNHFSLKYRIDPVVAFYNNRLVRYSKKGLQIIHTNGVNKDVALLDEATLASNTNMTNKNVYHHDTSSSSSNISNVDSKGVNYVPSIFADLPNNKRNIGRYLGRHFMSNAGHFIEAAGRLNLLTLEIPPINSNHTINDKEIDVLSYILGETENLAFTPTSMTKILDIDEDDDDDDDMEMSDSDDSSGVMYNSTILHESFAHQVARQGIWRDRATLANTDDLKKQGKCSSLFIAHDLMTIRLMREDK